MKTVLVLCTGNSCRSIMAEALINHLGKGAYKAVSAGSKPAGFVHTKSIETLKRHSIETGSPRSKSWDEFEGQTFDLVITVCDDAASEACPVFFGAHKKLHWSTPDPAGATGSEAEIDAAFEEAFALLKERVEYELRMKKFDPSILCPLCGIRTPQNDGKKWIAREHIPPKSLFIVGTPDLITVPSCYECNNLTSKHDLDFQHIIGLYTGRQSTPRWKKTLQSLNKNPIRQKKKQTILENFSPVLIQTKAGWWGHQLKVEKQPIDIVVKKIVKGLQDILNQYGKIHSIGNGSFSTHYAIAEDHDHASMWKLTFDQQDCFFVIIDPKRTKEQ